MSLSAAAHVPYALRPPARRASPPHAAHALAPSCTAAAPPCRRRRRSISSGHGPLHGVVAIVDVRVGADAQIDCSDVVARKLRELGACTVKRFTPKLTHVVLSHVTPVWKAKIVKWQSGGGSVSAGASNGASARAAAGGGGYKRRYELHIVSQLWVNACYVSKQKRDERAFFPVRQQQQQQQQLEHATMERRGPIGASETVPSGQEPVQHHSQRRRGRPSLGHEPLEPVEGHEELRRDKTDDTSSGNGQETQELDNAVVDLWTPSPVDCSKVHKTQQKNKRKVRAQSMEPLASDAILKLLGGAEAVPRVEETCTPVKQMIRSRRVTSSVKRRKTLNGPPTQLEDVTASPVRGVNAVSEVEIDKKSGIAEQSNDGIVVPDCQASLCLSGASSAVAVDSEKTGITGSPDDKSKSAKRTTARELRRRNRNSLPYGSGLTLKAGIWSCAACGCSNPRARRCCTDCQALKGTTVSPGSSDSVSPLVVASPVAEASKTLPATSAITSAPATLRSESLTPPTGKERLPSSARKSKTPSSCLPLPRRDSRSLTRPTASSAAKVRTPSPGASRVSRSVTKTSASSADTTSRTQSPAVRSSILKHKSMSALVANALIPTVAREQSPVMEKGQKKLQTTGDTKVTQGSAKKRFRPPFSSNTLTTPVVKKARRNINMESTTDKRLATPGSVSGFLRKHWDVNSTPIPMAMNFSTAVNSCRLARTVISITGVSTETRGVLECAIHAIDANMTNDAGYRKARMVKSVDYAAGVTHLIVGKGAKRTIKVLFAIARGAWIVSEDWAFSSLEQERWLPEEDFELTMFANKYAREHPESRQKFKGMKFFVGSNVEPSREVLQSLIQVAGGEICNQISVADICICGDASLFRRARRTGIRAVTSKWVFDSIAGMKLEDEAKYEFTEPMDVLAKTPTKSRRAVVSGLEAHSTVPE